MYLYYLAYVQIVFEIAIKDTKKNTKDEMENKEKEGEKDNKETSNVENRGVEGKKALVAQKLWEEVAMILDLNIPNESETK